jgi:hypothetical protein
MNQLVHPASHAFPALVAPKGRLRQLWRSAPAPLRACTRHHSSCVTLRLRFNLLPQPGVSIIRAAPHQYCASQFLIAR